MALGPGSFGGGRSGGVSKAASTLSEAQRNQKDSPEQEQALNQALARTGLLASGSSSQPPAASPSPATDPITARVLQAIIGNIFSPPTDPGPGPSGSFVDPITAAMMQIGQDPATGEVNTVPIPEDLTGGLRAFGITGPTITAFQELNRRNQIAGLFNSDNPFLGPAGGPGTQLDPGAPGVERDQQEFAPGLSTQQIGLPAQAQLPPDVTPGPTEPPVDEQAAFNERLAQAVLGIGNQFSQQLSDTGLSPDILASLGLQDRFDTEVGRIGETIPNLAANPASFFDQGIGTQVLSDTEIAERNRLTGELNQFAAPGFATTALPDTIDDAILAAILGEQRGRADQFIGNAFQRGNLNQTGFDTAGEELGNQATGASARLGDIGQSAIEGGRGELRGLADTAFSTVGSLGLGQPFDVGATQEGITGRTGDITSSLEGRIRNTIGGENFFDPASLVNLGASQQGLVNPQPIQGALQQRENERNKTRGLGTQGVF